MEQTVSWPVTAQQRRQLAAERVGCPRLENIWVAVPVPRTVELDRLHDALRRTAADHEILRASFVDLSSDGRMAVTGERPPPLQVMEVQGVEVMDVLAAHRTRTFDREGGLWEAALLRTSSGAALSLVLDGLVADGISAGVVLRDLLAPPGPGTTPASRLCYGDFARWQADRYKDCGGAEAEYWRATLAGVAVNRPVALPFCANGRAALSGEVETRSLDLGPALAGVLARAAGAARTTAFVVLLAAVHRWLADSTGERDLSVRVRVHGRPSRHARTVGLFADDIVLRVPHVADELRDVVTDVRARWVEVTRNQLFPYERLVACVESDRFVSDHRPVEVTVNAPSLPRAGQGLIDGALPHERSGAADVSGLAFTLSARPDLLRVSVTYDLARFAAADVEDALERYADVVRSGVT